MSLPFIAELSWTLTGWLLGFWMWFLIWAPLVALLEYAAHRWIMHRPNRLLDPRLRQLRAHGTHHQGHNEHEFVDMPLKNCLLVTCPVFLLLIGWALVLGNFVPPFIRNLHMMSFLFFVMLLSIGPCLSGYWIQKELMQETGRR